MRASACLIKRVASLREGDAAGSARVCVRGLAHAMRLDAAAVRACNLLPSARDAAAVAIASADVNSSSMSVGGGSGAGSSSGSGGGGASGVGKGIPSVHGLLSYHSRTKGGKRLLKQWLLQPLVDLDAITRRQDLVTAFVDSVSLRRSWREGVSVPDLEALAARMARPAAGLMDLLRLYQFALLLPRTVERLQAYDGPVASGELLQSLYIAPLAHHGAEFGKYCEMIEALVEDPTALDAPRVAPSWSDTLKALAAEREELEEGIAEVWQSAKSSKGWAADLGEELRCERDKQRGFVFRTKKTYEKTVRAIPGVQICQVLKDGIYFTTTGSGGLKRLAERLMVVEADYDTEQRSVVAKAMEVARSYLPVLEAAAVKIAELDAYCALANVATCAPGTYVRPTLVPDVEGEPRRLRIVAGRHPVLEMQDHVSFIANNYDFLSGEAGDAGAGAGAGVGGAAAAAADGGSDGEGEGQQQRVSRFQIITGPNMGGKSTYIRTLAVLAVMAQIGSYVPAESAVLPLFDCVCARVGAGDRALKGVSTFMAEMMEAASILETATDRSLVIIDELGRGTSTYDGFGLAWAISEHLACTTRCFTLFATHFHELTALEAEVRGVSNKHVTAHTSAGAITMLYEVREGACPSSFGIHVAELAAFPPAVIATARAKAAQLEATSELSRGASSGDSASASAAKRRRVGQD